MAQEQNAVNINVTALQPAAGGTGIATATTDGLLIGNGTSGIQSMAAATNGQIPIGTSGTPTIANISAMGGMAITNGAGTISVASTTGNWVLLSSQTSGYGFTSLISSTYTNYVWVISSLLPATATSGIVLYVSTNNGSGYLGSGYISACNSQAYTTATLTNSNASTGIFLSPYTTLGTTSLYNAIVMGYNIGNGGVPFFTFEASYVGTAGTAECAQGSAVNSTSGINAVSFQGGSGGITSGTITMYGVLQ
jgi:hypothetical protein